MTLESKPPQAQPKKIWRSLDELRGEQAPERREAGMVPFGTGGFDRRRFLQLSSASLAFAGLSACTRQPPEEIVPYVRAPEDLIPGKPLFFASASLQGGYARGVLVESHMGRPTKVEGLPGHPASLGATDIFAQASILDLYDPDRSGAVSQLGRIRSWASCAEELVDLGASFEKSGGKGLHILTGSTTSPSLGALFAELGEKMPDAVWHQWEPAGRESTRRASMQAFGEYLETSYDLEKADVVVALDGDFLNEGPAALRYAKDFASRRRARDSHAHMSRLYSVESSPTALSSVADHRLGLKPSQIGVFAAALAAKLGVAGVTDPRGLGHEDWVAAVADDLKAHRGSSLVIPGEFADPSVHVLAQAINEALGNFGTTVRHTAAVEVEPCDHLESMRALVEALNAGEVDTLVILDSNPLYSAPASLDFGNAIQKARIRFHLGLYEDETAALCQWHIPMAHALESWWDARSFDGTMTIGQPLVVPLYDGKTPSQILAVLLGRPGLSSLDIVRAHWEATCPDPAIEKAWRRSVHDGWVASSSFPGQQTALLDGAAEISVAAGSGSLELTFRPDPTVWDGRYANNGWLQECPKPVTKLTWDNALLLSPATARALGVPDPFQKGDQRGKAPRVRISVGEAAVELPVWIVPGHAEGVGTLHSGYGRRRAGRVGSGTGFDIASLRGSDAVWQVAEGVEISALGDTSVLSSTQDHHSMQGRHLVAMGDLETLHHDAGHILPHHHVDTGLTILPEDEWVYDGHAWGMSIDLTTCTGCNACLLACQAENNIPSVGKEQVAAGREMHWIRLDRYFTGDGDTMGEIVNQPVNCMHCEQAPCEVVCPVGATVHSDEGLNDMVYNRCVGTRYCSNNCPYKVRRFNFFLYQDFETPSLQLGRNPDVTVRSRGVMEKCTYCVQRINQARITAKKEDRRVRDGEVVTACQQVCPSDAIVFGDVNDETSAVTQAKSSVLDYSLLEELGTRPRTTYLARIRNPNPKLAGSKPAASGDEHA